MVYHATVRHTKEHVESKKSLNRRSQDPKRHSEVFQSTEQSKKGVASCQKSFGASKDLRCSDCPMQAVRKWYASRVYMVG